MLRLHEGRKSKAMIRIEDAKGNISSVHESVEIESRSKKGRSLTELSNLQF
jgi:hypothetical protein